MHMNQLQDDNINLKKEILLASSACVLSWKIKFQMEKKKGRQRNSDSDADPTCFQSTEYLLY